MMTHESEKENKKGDKNNANYLLTVRASQGIIFWLLSRLSITALVRQEGVKRTEKRAHKKNLRTFLIMNIIRICNLNRITITIKLLKSFEREGCCVQFYMAKQPFVLLLKAEIAKSSGSSSSPKYS